MKDALERFNGIASEGEALLVCVSTSRLSDCIEETRADIAASGVFAPIAGHVRDGNFHLAFVLDPASAVEHATAEAVNDRLVQRAVAMGGICTGEHGIGMWKKGSLRLDHRNGVVLMDKIRAALDPAGILNPGKVL
ncbi:FAD-binding oxidoreductase [Arthrobacter terrae]|uniref:FAD-binding oxidoreductase n=1 Tax=Arthrobacter terrae TaxID=2935737 RepID=UPI0018C30EB6|nr:FAD-linked oxidase C-terminal domain-containing protein [Arthrobacter terrae]